MGHHARRDRAQAQLGAELEERVRLEARLLGLAVLAGADGRLHPVERQRDQVEVGLGVVLLPLLREAARRAGPTRACVSPRRRPRARPRAPLARVLDVALELLERASTSAVRLRIALGRAPPRGRRTRTRRRRGTQSPPGSRTGSSRAVVGPSRYSIGTSSRKRTSCAARRACSSGVKGAATKPSSTPVAASAAARKAPGRAARAADLLEEAASASARAAAPRARSYSGARIIQRPAAFADVSASRASKPRSCACRPARAQRRGSPGRRRAGPSSPRAGPWAGRSRRSRARAPRASHPHRAGEAGGLAELAQDQSQSRARGASRSRTAATVTA